MHILYLAKGVHATTAIEGNSLSEQDALELTLLMARHGDRRYRTAAVRWLGRYILERAPSLPAAASAFAAVAQLPDDEAVGVLRTALRRRYRPVAAALFR